MDTCNADPLRQLTTSNRTFTLAPPRQSYTIGPDASLDIEAPRPENILRANMIDLSAAPNPPHIPMRVLTWSEYQEWSIRNSPTPLPTALWYDSGYSPIANPLGPSPPAPAPAPEAPVAGYGTINIVGIPTAANQIELWTAQPLTQASSYFDQLVFPPGYYEFLLYGLCCRLYPRFGRETDSTIAALYKDAQRIVESANVSAPPTMALDKGLPGSPGYWDGRTNSYIYRG